MFKIPPKSGCLETEIRLELLLIYNFYVTLIRISTIHKKYLLFETFIPWLALKTIRFIHWRINIGIQVIFSLKWFFFNKIEHYYVKHCDLFFWLCLHKTFELKLWIRSTYIVHKMYAVLIVQSCLVLN